METVNGDETQSEERLKHQERHENKLKDINTETQGEPKKNIRNSSQTNLKTANVTKKRFKNKNANEPYSNVFLYVKTK